jgi:hypothetical protein
MSTPKLIDTRHPVYTESNAEWIKWRLAYEGGPSFVKSYLKPLSKRENSADLQTRMDTTYCPGCAAAAIDEIKDSILSRMIDVQRIGGPLTYRERMVGSDGGVDLLGSTLTTFIGTQILPELLVMRRVGVLVDAPSELGLTLADKQGKGPYVGKYCTESILSWSYTNTGTARKLTNVLLKENIETCNEYGLPCGIDERYRHMQLTNTGVLVTFYNKESIATSTMLLELDRIPFTIFEIPVSLMQRVADHEIALLNMESADISYALKSNFPFYYEFYDPKSEAVHFKPTGVPGASGTDATSKGKEVGVGSGEGRRFPKDTEAPGFINPDPDTLRVSMEKEEQIKEDIRKLVHLNLIQIGRQAADSKREDRYALESSLSFIGLVLERGENDIGLHWASFESQDQPKIKYPQNYSLKTETERRSEAKELNTLMHALPSGTYKRSVAKKIARIMLNLDVTDTDLNKIYTEIDEAPTLTSDPDQIIADHAAGLVDDETASLARGYKPGVVEQARIDRAERIRLTLEAQGGPQNASAARGASDFGGQTGADEKIGKPKRGESTKVNTGGTQ